MMTGQNIVCFANDWESDPTSKHQIMRVLARENRVLWVNSIGLRKPSATVQDTSRMLKKVKQFCRGAVAVAPNLHVMTPLLIPIHGVKGVDAINAWLVSRVVRRQARKLGMQSFQVWTFLPTTAPLIPYLKPQKLLYYCVDEWSAFSFLDGPLMRELEERLIRQSDLVIVSAQALYDSKKHLNPLTYLVPHGVDLEYFADARAATTKIADELQALPQPIIGFWGLIHEWIDLELVDYAARSHPEWSFALIGKVATECENLKRRPNVHLLGPCPYDRLAGYAKGFSAAILPFRINRLTDNVNPIKLREYLAAGLPVVSTDLPEVRAYKDLIHIGVTPEDFTKKLELAIQDTNGVSAQKRMEAVKDDGWQSRVEYLSNLVTKCP